MPCYFLLVLGQASKKNLLVRQVLYEQVGQVGHGNSTLLGLLLCFDQLKDSQKKILVLLYITKY
jgi:hypothetical protein